MCAVRVISFSPDVLIRIAGVISNYKNRGIQFFTSFICEVADDPEERIEWLFEVGTGAVSEDRPTTINFIPVTDRNAKRAPNAEAAHGPDGALIL